MDDEKEKFCAELRRKTKQIHDQSDKLVNLKLAVALTDTELYGKVLIDFYHVYMTLEGSVKQLSDHAVIGKLQTTGLERTKAFEKDIRFFLGENWSGKYTPSKEAQEYCDRILHVSDRNPVLLIAYVHSMYLAILAGGQILSRIIRTTLGLSGQDGLAIFHFSPEHSKLQLKKELMSSIDELPLTRETKDEIIEEKKIVFKMNNSIAANVRPTWGSYSRILKFLLLCLIVIIVIGNVLILLWI